MKSIPRNFYDFNKIARDCCSDNDKALAYVKRVAYISGAIGLLIWQLKIS